MKKAQRALSLTLAATMAMSSSICVFAEGMDSEALKTMLARVKSRLDIPEDYSEFTYNVNNRNTKDRYTFNWTTKPENVNYGSIEVTICSTVITSYNSYSYDDYRSDGYSLAELSGDELYKKAAAAIKKLNPTVYKNIDIDRDSLSISLGNDRATFSLCRTKNGLPVANDRGSIVLDKNTGELKSFYINWHTDAGFKQPKNIISEEKAMDKYGDMIDIEPMYLVYYDYELGEYSSRLVYSQTNHGEINAFTGKKSNFAADGYYGDDEASEDEAVDSAESATTNGAVSFTPEELAEITKELSYGNEEAAKKLLKDSEYMYFDDSMELSYSTLRKDSRTDEYIYRVSFTNDKKATDEPDYNDDFSGESPAMECYVEVSLVLNADTGEIHEYEYYDSDSHKSLTYDEEKAAADAAAIAREFAGGKLDEYKHQHDTASRYTENNQKYYYGSYHQWQREANGIGVSGETLNIAFNAKGVLSSYSIYYTDVEFADTKDMLTEDEVLEKFWENHDIELYYLAGVNEKKTKTVLVYGVDGNLNVDAFTGEPYYGYYIEDTEKTDISGIKDKKLRNKAEVLMAHGLLAGAGKISADDVVTEMVFANVLNRITEVRLYGMNNQLQLADGRKYTGEDKKLTNGDAMIMLAAAECGTKVAELGGIFKSPYKDVKETDKNIGYYAIAHALTGSESDTLNADGSFTYGEIIEMVYSYLT